MKKYTLLDINTYPRREHFAYFSDMANPYAGVTVETDITELYDWCRKNEVPFFLSFLYCAGRACNAVAEFRQRIKDGRIIEFESCDTSHTVMRTDGTYGYCRLDCMRPFDEFLPYASKLHEEAKQGNALDGGDDELELIFVSCLPWLHYTALAQPTPTPADSNPRVTWGKYVKNNDGHVSLPVTVLVNHALADGAHIAGFYSALQREIKMLSTH